VVYWGHERKHSGNGSQPPGRSHQTPAFGLHHQRHADRIRHLSDNGERGTFQQCLRQSSWFREEWSSWFAPSKGVDSDL